MEVLLNYTPTRAGAEDTTEHDTSAQAEIQMIQRCFSEKLQSGILEQYQRLRDELTELEKDSVGSKYHTKVRELQDTFEMIKRPADLGYDLNELQARRDACSQTTPLRPEPAHGPTITTELFPFPLPDSTSVDAINNISENILLVNNGANLERLVAQLAEVDAKTDQHGIVAQQDELLGKLAELEALVDEIDAMCEQLLG